MALKTEDIVTEALQLPHDSRALLAEKLLESLDSDDPFEVSQAWLDEARRRCREIDEGKVELIPAEEVFAEARREAG